MFLMKVHSQPFVKFVVMCFLVLFYCAIFGDSLEGGGRWQLLLNNTRVVPMQMVLTHHNTVIMSDRAGPGQSRFPLSRRHNRTKCRHMGADMADSSCYAHSVEYDIARNRIRPLNLETDTLGSSGSILSNGTLIQTGGFHDGSRRMRYFQPCNDGKCDWKENRKYLSAERFYASNQVLPHHHDRIIIVGGIGEFSYEFVPKLEPRDKYFTLPMLHKAYDKNEGGNNLYPIIHLCPDGNLFIFANRDSVLLNYKRSRIVKTFPRIPGKASRSHPSTASSVLLPLDYKNGFKKAEVLICGGAAPGAYKSAQRGKFLKGLTLCGRIVVSGNKNKWSMEHMPGPRLMHDMLILPTGDVLIINGAKNGCAGWNNASNPALQPYLYKHQKTLGRRFSILRSTKIARMYQSTAVLLPDGRVLIGGSNPNNRYTFHNVPHPTELRLQAFEPEHMDKHFDHFRPQKVSIYNSGDEGVRYGESFGVNFHLREKPNNVMFTAYAPPFNTHSMSMNQRLVVLNCLHFYRNEDGWIHALVEAPPNRNVAPPGYYLLTVVNDEIPSTSLWIKFINA